MSNRAIRRAAERAARKAAKREQKEQPQAQTHPQVRTAAAAAGASFDPISPKVDFAEAEAEDTTPSNDHPNRPVSDAQRTANRVNAQKNTGPTSPEGRAKSSLNAVKTALTGVTVLLPSDDVQAYEAHVQQHIADYSPVTPAEKNLVQRIADADWRINRIASLEAGIYAIGLRKLDDLHPDEQDPAVRQSLIKSEIYLAYRRDLNNLALQERRLRNHQTADLAKLQALQKERQSAKGSDARRHPAEELRTASGGADDTGPVLRESEEKNDEKAKIEGRMHQAIRLLVQSKESKTPFDPAQFGFEFSLPEITYCYGVVCDAESMNLPVPLSLKCSLPSAAGNWR